MLKPFQTVLRSLALAALLSALKFSAAFAQGSFIITNDLIAERIEHLAAQSETFAQEIETIKESPLLIAVVPFDVAASLYPNVHKAAAGDMAGYTAAVHDGSGVVTGAVVAVDIARVERLVEKKMGNVFDVKRAIDQILIHEIHGHLIPIVEGGTLASSCPDPVGRSPKGLPRVVRRAARERAPSGNGAVPGGAVLLSKAGTV